MTKQDCEVLRDLECRAEQLFLDLGRFLSHLPAERRWVVAETQEGLLMFLDADLGGRLEQQAERED